MTNRFIPNKRFWWAENESRAQEILDATGDPNRWHKFEALMLRFIHDESMSSQEFGHDFQKLLEATDTFLIEQKLINKHEGG